MLFRRLLTGLLCIFALAAAGIETIYVAAARNGLQERLAAQSQDAATALSLSLATALAQEDVVLAETIVGAVFDRGSFGEIRVVDAHGATLVWRHRPADAAEVPDWFASLVPLDAAPALAPIAAGWHYAGRVSVASLPNVVHRQLWDTLLASLAWLLVLFVAAATLAAEFLRGILRSMRHAAREFERADDWSRQAGAEPGARPGFEVRFETARDAGNAAGD
ncbi:MAG: hypothetical protein HZC24_13255 [Rhodocyclales bacterium]|nr:hypothetical protein [Rhodocyclales bacterium]